MSTYTVTTDGDDIIFKAPDGAVDLIDAVRTVPGAYWDGTRQVITMPTHRRTARALRSVLSSPVAAGLTAQLDPDTVSTLRTVADTLDPNPDVFLGTDADGQTVIIVDTPHSNGLRDDLKKTDASFENSRWHIPVASAAHLTTLAAKHDLTIDQPVKALTDKKHGPFLYDGTVDGLRGVPVTELSTVPTTARGKQTPLADRFAEYGITSVYDLLMTVPRRYLDRSSLLPIRDLTIGEEVGLVATVTSVGRYDRQKRLVRHVVSDGTGTISITFFSSPWQAYRFKEGEKVAIWGKLDVWSGNNGRRVLQMTNPVMDPLDDDTALIVPIYPQSAKNSVTTWDLHTAAMEAVRRLGTLLDPVPPAITTDLGLPSRQNAYTHVHHPESITDAEVARKRLAFDEFLRMQLALLMSKYATDDTDKGVTHRPDRSLTTPYLQSLPYKITGAQQRALRSIMEDLDRASPMHRLLQGDVGSGKAQPLDSLVLTPKGFVEMGSIEPGDEVVVPSGETARVLGVFPQGPRKVFEVTFTDGSTVRADGDHLWNVRTSLAVSRGSAHKTMTTMEIAADLTSSNGSSKWYVDPVVPVDLDTNEARPLDPYLLGCLLGDGGLTQPSSVNFTCADVEMIEHLRTLLPSHSKIVGSQNPKNNPYGYRIVGDWEHPHAELSAIVSAVDVNGISNAYASGASMKQISVVVGKPESYVRGVLVGAGVDLRSGARPNPVLESLRGLGLMGHGAHSKRIPTSYMNAPIHVRHAILQGVLDTDGYAPRPSGATKGHRSAVITLASKGLVEDIIWITRSLGGKATLRRRVKADREFWGCTVSLPDEFPPFRLARKAERITPRTKYNKFTKGIKRIEEVAIEPTQCILVDHPSHLYVTDGFTPTHNTTVALTALLMAVEGGHQGALMAPTDILAWQLYREAHETTTDLRKKDGSPIRVEYLSGKTKAKDRRTILADLANGDVDILVGTHALLVEDVVFASLGLVIIDEQHRFGVEQRAKLREKNGGDTVPDMLVMTATPIPRTAAMTVYGDLDLTVLDELPPGRTPITTEWIRSSPVLDSPLEHPWDKVLDQIAQGRQAYVVTPLVEESEKLQAASATETYDALVHGALTGLRVGLVHGQMPPAERDETMAAFKAGELDVIVATTVIEVGVNVPNASIIVILDAPRFGLAQLHQLRGRVGRAQHASFCYLVGDPNSADGVERMQAMVRTTSGFELAEVDAKLRGVGAVYGTKQAGKDSDLRVGDIRSDLDLIVAARDAATRILENDHDLKRQPVLRMEILAAVGPEAAAWLTRS